jgi:hypothetical protein
MFYNGGAGLLALFTEVFNLAAGLLFLRLFGGAFFLHAFLRCFLLVFAHGGSLRWSVAPFAEFLNGKSQLRESRKRQIDYFALIEIGLFESLLTAQSHKKSPCFKGLFYCCST